MHQHKNTRVYNQSYCRHWYSFGCVHVSLYIHIRTFIFTLIYLYLYLFVQTKCTLLEEEEELALANTAIPISKR